jgi:myo-inositol-1(or 4)-monophosphatase
MDVAAQGARDVGELLRAAFALGGAVATKRDFHDLVTAQDRMVEDRLASFLLERVPDSSIHGEEGGQRGTGLVRWHVDPIDGTNNFASRIPFFCVSIAAEQEGRLVAGVIYDPIRSELFSACEDGAWCNGSPIVARGAATEPEAMLVTDFPAPAGSGRADDGTPDLELFGRLVERFGSVRRLGSSALALAYVAAGRVDVTMGTTANPWDVAAGLLLVRAAGGTYHALPPSALHASRPWLASSYVAHVADFDYAGSALAPSRAPDGLDLTGRRPVPRP